MSEKIVPGTKLTVRNVFDAVFGWHKSESVGGQIEWTMGVYDVGKVSDVWSIDEL